MAEEALAAETTILIATTTTTTTITTTTEDMDLESVHEPVPKPESGDDDSQLKRSREDEEENGDGAKKLKVEEDKSVEEQRYEKLEGGGGGDDDEEEKGSDRVTVGPKIFGSGVEMFDYFFKFLHFWSPNVNVNKYEHMVLLDLLKKGHAEPEKKIGSGIQSFQVRFHPMFKSRCFFLVREDESVDDFSFRKCVDHILPLPENMKVKQEVNKGLGRGGRGGRGGGGRGYGRGGRRN